MRNVWLTCGLILVVICLNPLAADDFEKVKADLGRSGCHRFEFESAIESDVFDETDVARGLAYISSDGRYFVEIGDETYLNDLTFLYTYSQSSGQVIVEKIDTLTRTSGDELSFILRLNELYETYPLRGSWYRLIKKRGASASYPDSMAISTDKAGERLRQIEYFDVNEELNRITILKQTYQHECDTTRFVPDFPDSAEVIRL